MPYSPRTPVPRGGELGTSSRSAKLYIKSLAFLVFVTTICVMLLSDRESRRPEKVAMESSRSRKYKGPRASAPPSLVTPRIRAAAQRQFTRRATTTNDSTHLLQNSSSSNSTAAGSRSFSWPETDLNHGFTPNRSLPLVGIITLNAQAGGKDKRKRIQTSHDGASWIHSMSYHNKVEYAKKWGYDLIIEDNDIVDKTRDVAWSKIPIWKKWLPKYQWLMWMDMDAFFMRHDLDVASFLDDSKDVIIAKDWHGINMGIMFVRNSPFTFALLEDMWETPIHWWHPWHEQSALMNILDAKRNPSTSGIVTVHFKFPAQRDFNSYPGEFAYGNKLSRYQEGDFIAHFPNCKGHRTCQTTIRRFYNKSLVDNKLPPLKGPVPASLFPGVVEVPDGGLDGEDGRSSLMEGNMFWVVTVLVVVGVLFMVVVKQ